MFPSPGPPPYPPYPLTSGFGADVPDSEPPSFDDLPPDPEAGVRKIPMTGRHHRIAGPLTLADIPLVQTTAEAVAGGAVAYSVRRSKPGSPVRGVRISDICSIGVEIPGFADDRWVRLHATARAIQLTSATAIVDGFSAARLYGFPLPLSPESDPLELCVPETASRSKLPNVVTRRSRWYEPTDWFDVRTNSYRNVVVGLANRLSERDLIKLLDGIAGPFHGPVRSSVADLTEWLNSSTVAGIRGIRRLRRAVARARDFVRSPMETEWRLLMIENGLPEPLVNLEVDTGNGGYLEIDLALKDYKIAVEYHGREFHLRSPAQIAHDNRRRLILERLGWKVIVITSERPTWEQLDEIRLELRARGWRG